MLRIETPAPNRVDLHIAGQIDATQMRVGLDKLVAASEDVTKGLMYYEITDFTLPTPGALMVEFGQLPRLFSLIGRFRRCAVVSDAAWIRNAAEIEGRVFPGLTIRSFTPAERDAAEAWLIAED